MQGEAEVRTSYHVPFQASRAAHGFSLLEIMVAVALLAVIIVGLLAMFYQVQRAFRAGTAQVDVMEGGRAAMNLLTRDLQGVASVGADPAVTNLVILPPENLLEVSQLLVSGAPRYGWLQDLCFMSRDGDEWIGTAYRFSNAVSGVGTLCRLVERRAIDSNPATAASTNAALSWLVSTVTPDKANLPPYLNTTFSPLLDGIVHFSVDAYDAAGLIFTNAFLPDRDNPAPFGYGFTSTNLPAYLDIQIAMLEPSALAKFRARVDFSLPFPQSIERATNYLSRQIGKTHVFRQRIALKVAGAPGYLPLEQ
jgi:prepilin-type N-terminal cleavage/methylation domain-containing protein